MDGWISGGSLNRSYIYVCALLLDCKITRICLCLPPGWLTPDPTLQRTLVLDDERRLARRHQRLAPRAGAEGAALLKLLPERSRGDEGLCMCVYEETISHR